MRVSSSAILIFSTGSMLQKKRLPLNDVPGTPGHLKALQQATWLRIAFSS